MLTVGVALFATFSGFLANAFLSAKRSEPVAAAAASDVAETLREAEELHARQQEVLERLRAQVRGLEQSV
jgi:7-keto-8-aminopelargonate synthetase-like enzyme